jgi:TonB-dependent receptor
MKIKVMRSFIALLTLISLSFTSLAQKGKIEGKITDARTGQPIAGVSVILNGSQTGVSTNTDGYFVITAAAGKQALNLSSTSYQEKRVDEIEVTAGQVVHIDIVMDVKAKTGEAVIVKSSSARKESVAALIGYQKNTSVVAQVISAESIRRSPDKNTGEVLKRVPGLSILDGKYLVVRGLADRYNQAMLNGVLMGSTEPDRKAFSFDILPSSIIDNIIINKAFVPEMSGEWAGGLIQVNTNDVPSKNFMDISFGTGFNTQTVGHDFYKYDGGKLDIFGFDDGKRALPNGLPSKSNFNMLDQGQKTEFGKQFENIWTANKSQNNSISLISKSFKFSTGFSTTLGKNNKLGGVFALNYNFTPKRTEFENRIFSISNNIASTNFDYYNNKYSNDVLWGALANFTIQLGSKTKISIKNIFNVNTTDYTTIRVGKDFESNSTIGDNIRATELAFKANTFFNTQISGDHSLTQYNAKLHWFGSFQILDQYIPDQRRVQYNQDDPSNLSSPYSLLISSSKSSQRTGSRYYGFLSDYNYTAGGDVTKNISINNKIQTIKAGYFFQVKDRLFDSRPFAIYLPIDNPALRHLNQDVIFSPENFGNGIDNKFAFNEIYDNRYRYLANSILNAGFLQFDNQLLHDKLRIVWGVRVEDYDQLIGSVKQSDTRFVHIQKRDYLPGVNLTYKVNSKNNIRLSGSQTVIRPEFRELSSFSFFDFDLGATVTGNPSLERTKVSNADLRYEIYPRGGELITLGAFYKYFKSPTELYFNNTGAGSSGTFNYISPDHAYSYGAELDFRKKLDFSKALRNFTLHGNVAYIYNRVTDLNRPMQGQSPYLLNLGLQYDIEKSGLTTTLLFNQIGRRIYYVGGSDVPPVWEAPRPLLDLQISKKVAKNKGEFRLNIADLLNQEAKFYHDLNDNGKYDNTDALAIKRKYGTNVSISFSYKIK